MNARRLLVADEDAPFRASLAAVLRFAGFDVTLCSPAHAGDRLAPGALPIVVVDSRARAGMDLVRRFRSASIEVLAVVGCCDGFLREELELLGCHRLDKPVERAALLAGVESLLRRTAAVSGRVE